MLRIHHDTVRIDASVPAWIEVDHDAIRHNLRLFLARIPRTCELIAVVKADAYGHGMLAVAATVLAHGAHRLAVASVAEGLALRAAGIGGPILIAGPTLPGHTATMVDARLTPAIGSDELARDLIGHAPRGFAVEIEVDTGMHRHGLPPAAAAALARDLTRTGRLHVAGIYTHFRALADDASDLRAQWHTFAELHRLLHRDLPGLRHHACNTLATAALPEAHADAVRIGGGLLGFEPLPATRPLGLRPALSLCTRIAGLRTVAERSRIGYGGAFVSTRRTRLALLPIGYADGLPRAAWQGAEVLVRGQRVPIVGLISMNQTIVDVTGVADAATGDVVVLLGGQGEERILAEARTQAGTSPYETTTLLRDQLPRHHAATTRSWPSR